MIDVDCLIRTGAYVFWEFATDHYDLGFGVYFEWTDSPEQQVSVTVGETSDEDSEDGEFLCIATVLCTCCFPPYQDWDSRPE